MSLHKAIYPKKLHSWFLKSDVHRLEEGQDESEKPFVGQGSSAESDADDEEHARRPVPPRRSCYRSGVSVVAIASIVLLGMIAFSVLVKDSRSGKVPNAPKAQVQGGSVVTAHCGTTPEEAQDRGCFWDIMSFGWMHPSCFDQEESARWAAEYGPWEWYTERPSNATDLRPLTADELPHTPVVWTTQGYHVQHCLYVLKMIHLAAMAESPVSNEGIELGHTDHCTKLIANPELVDYGEVNTRVHLLFVQCVTLT
ncbi:hypothetical protein L228DRAFT_268489 [Xylona heveae TC161]|uniref:Uncharacterized protein n=1 Tax=Xylona heveae (strain CBS 132557 / TC161) TaxID=1328760 RepID=A0A165GBB6_XYLHT|nr:hypothetical protein L228DRAFT_268489 [Xylona heveae TC161]KZF21983.1 hypothetical protein L228DRAFT_268489 [Xylona heveae TC161]